MFKIRKAAGILTAFAKHRLKELLRDEAMSPLFSEIDSRNLQFLCNRWLRLSK